VARTVSIEVGMQNGGLAASLAREHFAAMPLAAAAGVFSGVMQNIIGGLLASWWKRRTPDDVEELQSESKAGEAQDSSAVASQS
jgi:BASS family bile acid:Na+ symporter